MLRVVDLDSVFKDTSANGSTYDDLGRLRQRGANPAKAMSWRARILAKTHFGSATTTNEPSIPDSDDRWKANAIELLFFNFSLIALKLF
jgi:ATP phosphoribosyltransferase regulatory subunit HisZ